MINIDIYNQLKNYIDITEANHRKVKGDEVTNMFNLVFNKHRANPHCATCFSRMYFDLLHKYEQLTKELEETQKQDNEREIEKLDTTLENTVEHPEDKDEDSKDKLATNITNEDEDKKSATAQPINNKRRHNKNTNNNA